MNFSYCILIDICKIFIEVALYCRKFAESRERQQFSVEWNKKFIQMVRKDGISEIY